MRLAAILALLLPALLGACSPSAPPRHPQLTVYKSPTCGCCTKWVDHLNAQGLSTQVEPADDIAAVQQRLGVPTPLSACHVATVGDYLIVGHVPAEDIRRLLAERPHARGLAVPGMPPGSPGMEQGDAHPPYETLLFQADGQSRVFARHGG